MRKDNLNYNKQVIINKAFTNKESEVEFCGEKFRIYEPNFCGGSIESNCKVFYDKDLKIIDIMKSDELDEMEKDIAYLQKLISKRRTELIEPVTITELNVSHSKDGNKKLIYITIRTHTDFTDTYRDNSNYIDCNYKTIETHKFSDTKSFQEDIQNKITELKEKYNIQ